MQTIKVILADDNAKFIQIVKNILAGETDIEIIGEARSGEEAIAKTQKLKPDIVLMDVRMPEMNGLEATARIKQTMPNVKVIILTVFDIDEYRKAAQDKGASGFVVKKLMKTELIPTIRRGLRVHEMEKCPNEFVVGV